MCGFFHVPVSGIFQSVFHNLSKLKLSYDPDQAVGKDEGRNNENVLFSVSHS